MSTDPEDSSHFAAGRDQGKKRKVDSEGFVRPNTPEIYKKPYFMHTAHSVQGIGVEERQKDTTSEYFHQTPEHLNYITNSNTEYQTDPTPEHLNFITNSNTEYQAEDKSTGYCFVNKDSVEDSTNAIQCYEETRPSHAMSAYLPEENYTPDRRLQSEDVENDRTAASQGQPLDNLQDETSGTGHTTIQYENGEEDEESSLCNYPQQQQQYRQTTARPNEEGDAATPDSTPVNEALCRWKEESDQLFDYWANIFRVSQDYEKKTVEKLSKLLSSAKALDQRVLQQREAVVQRVKGIGKILELQTQ